MSLGYLSTFNDVAAFVEFVKGYIDASPVWNKRSPTHSNTTTTGISSAGRAHWKAPPLPPSPSSTRT